MTIYQIYTMLKYRIMTLSKLNYFIITAIIYKYTVEPLNNGHFGTSNFWHNFTVIERLSSFRGKIVLPWFYWDHKICPLKRGQMYGVLYSECPLREVPLYSFVLGHNQCNCLPGNFHNQDLTTYK